MHRIGVRLFSVSPCRQSSTTAMAPFIFLLLVIQCVFVLRLPAAFASPDEKSLGIRILDAGGGRTKLDLELEKVSAQASLYEMALTTLSFPLDKVLTALSPV
jgi:hypothetical protein